MYKIVICIISLLPYAVFGESHSATQKIPTDVQQQQGSSDEDYFPDIPLSLDSSILNTRNSPNAQDTQSQVLLPNRNATAPGLDNTFKNINTTADTTQEIPEQTGERFIEPALRQKEKKYDFWKVKAHGPYMKKEYAVLPKEISRRKYTPMNSNFPIRMYISDYQKSVFAEIKRNNRETVRSLLEIIKYTEFRNGDGDTPLLYAMRIGKSDMIDFLIAISANAKAVDANGHDAYYIARQQDRFDILQVLNKFEKCRC